jgi:hypothetical protein
MESDQIKPYGNPRQDISMGISWIIVGNHEKQWKIVVSYKKQ